MRPISIINGIFLGTFGSITISLAVVLLIFFLLRGEHPQLEREMPMLLYSVAVFGVAAAAAAAAFLGHLRNETWKWYAEAGMLLAIGGISAFFLYL